MGTSPTTIAPSSEQPNTALRAGVNQLVMMAQGAQKYAQQYPQCADEMRQIAELIRTCMQKTQANQPPGEPAAGPY